MQTFAMLVSCRKGGKMNIEQVPFNKLLGIKKCTNCKNGLVALPESQKYANHLNTVHASAQFALGEAASGEYLFQRFKEIATKNKLIPVIRKTKLKFKKPAIGEIKAKAFITDEVAKGAIASIEKKGRAIIPVIVDITDSKNNQTMTATYEWFIQKI